MSFSHFLHILSSVQFGSVLDFQTETQPNPSVLKKKKTKHTKLVAHTNFALSGFGNYINYKIKNILLILIFIFFYCILV